MFELAQGHSIDKDEYDKEVPKLRSLLLSAQAKAFELAAFPILLLPSGVDGGGKGDVVNLLLEWMDPHDIEVHAMGDPTGEELSRPPMARFWRKLPPKGKLGVFFGSWYTRPIADRLHHRIDGPETGRELAEISRFERMLFDEGALFIKLWLHLSKKAQKRRFEKLAADPATAWHVTKEDWKHHKRYDRFRAISDHALGETNTDYAPWTVIDASDVHYRNLAVGRAVLDAICARLERGKRARPVRDASSSPSARASAAPLPSAPPDIDKRNLLAKLDLSLSLTDEQYERKRTKLQARLNALAADSRFRERAAVLVFEGNDASGKGGSIRRVTQALDARQYRVVAVAAPTEEERAQPYLWRFWRHVPNKGHFTMFDRSWYGRVLVERVESLTPEKDWMRAYGEIVDFEESLVRFGIVVVKFWLAISKAEQLQRFRAREDTSFKRFKITKEDWRNRRRWKAYEGAVGDMVDRTSTPRAPWHLIEANDKKWARVKVLETICSSIERAF
jgi:polyphosphate:AMP phosphotransferase